MLTQTNTLSQSDVEFYEREGYLLLKGILPPEVLSASRLILDAWVRQTTALWKVQGLLTHDFQPEPFETGLLQAWKAAGQPKYIRSPRRDLVCSALYELLKHPAFLRVASSLLGTDEIASHGIFNARPKLPEQKFTDTPWHQDAQYYHKEDRQIHTLSMWYPVVPVDAESSCLAVSPWHRESRNEIFEIDENVDNTGFLGIRRSDSDQLESIPVPMEPGDLLVFHQLTPHRAMPNLRQRIRWSLDFRYLPADQASSRALQQGFIAASPSNPDRKDSLDDWFKKWHVAVW